MSFWGKTGRYTGAYLGTCVGAIKHFKELAIDGDLHGVSTVAAEWAESGEEFGEKNEKLLDKAAEKAIEHVIKKKF